MAYKQQTDVQVADAIRIGSVLFEIGPNVGALVDVGAIRDAKFEETFDKNEVKSDNAGVIDYGIRNHRASVAGNLMEINLENLAKFYAGVHTHDTIAAAPVNITDEEHTLNEYDFSLFTYRNGDRSEVGTIVVTDSAAAVTLVRDCDYIISVLANGFTGIARAYPTVVESASALITIATPGKTYTLSAGAWDVQPAVGDHIIVAGCGEAGNNGVKTVTEVTSTVITVDEACTAEAEGASITITRGGIADDDAVKVDYAYTPLASRKLDSGGKTQFTSQIARFTNYDVDDKVLRVTLWKVTPDSGISIDFPEDDAADPAMVPIKVVGVLDTGRTSGEQLFEIFDEQHAS